jgi:SAM-dependent methyltransferase
VVKPSSWKLADPPPLSPEHANAYIVVVSIMAEHSYSAGGYDWLATWRRMYDDERNQAEDAVLPGFVAQPDCWAGQAQRFATAAQRAPQPDGFLRFLLPQLHPSDRLIDIGAGTGRYEPLLANAVAELLAVEPSPSMRAQLEQRVADARLTNVRVVADAWPTADAAACDVAIAAHVLYGVVVCQPVLGTAIWRAAAAATGRAGMPERAVSAGHHRAAGACSDHQPRELC